MAQFVVIWSIFLCVSCLTLSNGNVVPQQATNVPVVNNNNVAEMGVGIGVGEDVDIGVDVDVGVAASVGGVAGVDEHVVASAVDSVGKDARVYHPAAVTVPRVIEQYDQRSLDGRYEYRYVLSNGDARYERAYWIPDGQNKVLARKGYYSYPLTNNKYLTVFYTADQNGYRQDSTTYSRSQPTLPRNIEVPEHVPSSMHVVHAPVTQRPSNSHVYTFTTANRPYQHPTGNPFIQLYPSAAQASAHHSSIGSQAYLSHGHNSLVEHSSVNHPSGVHFSAGGQQPSGAHSSSVGHHTLGEHASLGAPSTSGVHHSAVVKPGGAYPSVPSQSWHSSGVYSSANVPSSGAHSSTIGHSSTGVHASSVSGVSSSSAVHSSGAHSQAGIHSSSVVHSPSVIPPPSITYYPSGVSSSGVGSSSGVHSSTGVHSQAGIHSSSTAHSPSGAHLPSVHHSSVNSSVRSHSAQQHQPSAHASAAHSSVAATHPPADVPSVPVQSWHYNF